MRCYKEEIFGPVLVCLNVDTVDDAINTINANEYGNGAAVFTRSGPTAERFRSEIEAGQVGINVSLFKPPPPLKKHDARVANCRQVPIPVPLPMFSFTGNKKSIAGGGANTFYGKPGINFYTQTKTVTSLWRHEDALAQKASVNMPTQS